MQLNENSKDNKDYDWIEATKGNVHDPCVWLDRLAAIFRTSVREMEAGLAHPCTPLVEEFWPIISASCYRFKRNQRIVERTCRLGR